MPEAPPQNRNIIVRGASLGGVEALRVLVGALPETLDAAIFVVMHLSAEPATTGVQAMPEKWTSK